LSDYLDNPDLEDRNLARELLGMYADSVIGSMVDVLEPSLDDPADRAVDSTLWVVGHAIYLPAAALGVASIVDCSSSGLETILSSNTKEAEGYLIDISKEEADARYLARPSSQKGNNIPRACQSLILSICRAASEDKSKAIHFMIFIL
jgi:hypothetical protein